MKIQLALDFVNLEDALEVVKKVGNDVDIIEVGTSLIKMEGINAAKRIKEIAPNIDIFYDLKTIDGPDREAEIVNKSGSNRCSILGFSTEYTTERFIEKIDSETIITVDLQSVRDKLSVAHKFNKLGINSFCLHRTEGDKEDIKENIEVFEQIRSITKSEMMIAGGINLSNIKDVVECFKPDIVVIGGAITKSDNPIEILEKFKKII